MDVSELCGPAIATLSAMLAWVLFMWWSDHVDLQYWRHRAKEYERMYGRAVDQRNDLAGREARAWEEECRRRRAEIEGAEDVGD